MSIEDLKHRLIAAEKFDVFTQVGGQPKLVILDAGWTATITVNDHTATVESVTPRHYANVRAIVDEWERAELVALGQVRYDRLVSLVAASGLPDADKTELVQALREIQPVPLLEQTVRPSIANMPKPTPAQEAMAADAEYMDDIADAIRARSRATVTLIETYSAIVGVVQSSGRLITDH